MIGAKVQIRPGQKSYLPGDHIFNIPFELPSGDAVSGVVVERAGDSRDNRWWVVFFNPIEIAGVGSYVRLALWADQLEVVQADWLISEVEQLVANFRALETSQTLALLSIRAQLAILGA